jgi:thioredoxin 1
VIKNYLFFLIFLNITRISLAQDTNITSFYEGPFEDVIAEAKKSRKPIFIDFSATWCKPCLKMEQETFTNADIANKLNNDFIAYKVDVDNFDGMAVAQKYGVKEYPTYLILDSKTIKMGTIKGFYYANQFQKEINKIMDKPKAKVIPAKKKKFKLFSRN